MTGFKWLAINNDLPSGNDWQWLVGYMTGKDTIGWQIPPVDLLAMTTTSWLSATTVYDWLWLLATTSYDCWLLLWLQALTVWLWLAIAMTSYDWCLWSLYGVWSSSNDESTAVTLITLAYLNKGMNLALQYSVAAQPWMMDDWVTGFLSLMDDWLDVTTMDVWW